MIARASYLCIYVEVGVFIAALPRFQWVRVVLNTDFTDGHG